jgi:hypothetical protein
VNPFHREPTFYTTTNAEVIGYNKPDRESVVMRGGTAVRIKHPQAGHQGDYDAPIRMRAEGYRYITVVNSVGNVIFYTLTNGAADMNPNSEYALDRKQKARFHGWYRLGQCPVALLRAGEMHAGHFADESLLKAQPCQAGEHSLERPCKHALAEQAARRAKHNAIEQESADAHANKLVAAQAAQTDAITKAMGDQTEALMASNREALQMIAAALGGQPSQPAPDKGKKG